MYALAARELYKASGLEAKATILHDFQKNKLKAKRPDYPEFEPSFLNLVYSSKMTKQKNLVKYILMKIYNSNSTGLTADSEQMTMEHLAPENPSKKGALTAEQVASIGNVILLNQNLNNKLANKSFPDKVVLLEKSHVWLDPIISSAKQWGAEEIEKRTKLLAENAYEKVWVL